MARNKVIAVDLDNVMLTTNGYELKLMEAQGYPIVNPVSNDMCVRFGLTLEERYKWFSKNYKEVSEHASLVPGAKEGIAMLREFGVCVIFVTSRESGQAGLTLSQIYKFGLFCDGFIFESNKADFCRRNGIGVIVDDRPDRLGSGSEDIVCLMYRWDYNKHLEGQKNVVPCSNWCEVVSHALWLVK